MYLCVIYYRKVRKKWEDGGVQQQRNRELAEREARRAAQSGDEYDALLAKGTRYQSKEDYRRAAKANREAIALCAEAQRAHGVL